MNSTWIMFFAQISHAIYTVEKNVSVQYAKFKMLKSMRPNFVVKIQQQSKKKKVCVCVLNISISWLAPKIEFTIFYQFEINSRLNEISSL